MRIAIDEVIENGVVVSRTERIVSDREEALERLRDEFGALPWARLTPAQADAWIDSNVLTIAATRQALKVVARMLILLKDHIRPELG